MFLGTGTTSSVIHAAGAPSGGDSARPKALVVLVYIKDRTLAETASSRSDSVPVMFVSTKSCGECVMTWGLCSVAVWMTASVCLIHCLTKSRSRTDPTQWLN